MLGKHISSLLAPIAFLLAAIAAPAAAQQPVQLAGDVKVVKTTIDDNGQSSTELVDPDVVVPGDRLVFGTDYTNTGAEPVENFVVTNPLPSAVRLADDADPELTVSVDGGKSWGRLADLRVASDDGVSRDAQAVDVTHVRWTLASVAPGEQGRLEYHAIIR